MKAGDYVLISDKPIKTWQTYDNPMMSVYRDGTRLYQIRDEPNKDGFVHLNDPYKHNIKSGSHGQYVAGDYVWHTDWLIKVDLANMLTIDDGEWAEVKPVAKSGGLYYSDKPQIIEQQPGESDKAYLRRILGGR